MKPGNYQKSINVMGTVMPDKKIVLKSKVSGEVVFVSSKFVQGGLMKKGETLILLEDSDYKIELQKAKSFLDSALADLAIEQGSQMIAKEELKLIAKTSESEVKASDLALRKPQLIQAKAAVESARADHKKALLNLSRTKLVIPFNSLILEKHVDHGSLVTAQEPVATLVDVDFYKVEAMVPQDRLNMLEQKTVSNAIVSSQYFEGTWKGKVVRLTGQISSKSKMAGLVILLPDPLGLKNNLPQLLINDHVDVKIIGEPLENVFAIPRTLIRDNNSLWIYKAGVLEIKKIKPVWKDETMVYIKPEIGRISTGDLVITSNLPAPIKGMAI